MNIVSAFNYFCYLHRVAPVNEESVAVHGMMFFITSKEKRVTDMRFPQTVQTLHIFSYLKDLFNQNSGFVLLRLILFLQISFWCF